MNVLEVEKRRDMCFECHRPTVPRNYCLCSSFPVKKIDTDDIKIWILQHPLEKKKTVLKRTAWYTLKTFTNCEIIEYETSQSAHDYEEIMNKIKSQVINENEKKLSIVMFPDRKSVSLKEYLKNKSKPNNIMNLILLDGTWKQSKRIWKSISSITRSNNNIVTCYLEGYEGRFIVRRPPSKQESYLSTFETIVYALKEIKGWKYDYVQKLLHPLEVANQQWQSNVPLSIQGPKNKS